MRVRPGAEYLKWSFAGVVLLSLLVVLIWRLRPEESPAQQLALKATRVDLVSRVQVGLASSSEAVRSAVLATTDEDSQAFAGQALAAMAQVERARAELVPLLARPRLDRERALLAQFSEELASLRRLDEQILGLAVKNTNVKAYALAYGPAADIVRELDSALSRLADKRGKSADAQAVLRLAARARIAVLHIEVLIPPHIAEERSDKMDWLEAAMTAEERQASQDLAGLAALPSVSADPDLALARTRFGSFLELKSRILALSRENTNVASLALTLNQQRKAMALCVEASNALHQAILDEPIAGVTYPRLPTPTR